MITGLRQFKNVPLTETSVQTLETKFVFLSSQVNYDNAAIAHIVHEIAEFFKRTETPFQNKNIFLRRIYEDHAQLKTCVSIVVLFFLHCMIFKSGIHGE